MKAALKFILIITIFSGCAKNDNSLAIKIFQSTQKVDGFQDWYNLNKTRLLSVTRSELLNKNVPLQKAIFVNLSPKTKLDIWIDKLSEVSKEKLTSEKLDFIESVKANLTEDMFNFNSSKMADNYKYFALVKAKATELFGNDIAYSIFSNINNVSNFTPSFTPNVVVGNDCGCSTKSDWCSCGEDIYHCKWCQLGGCTTATWGCGTFLSYACDGHCSNQGYKE